MSENPRISETERDLVARARTGEMDALEALILGHQRRAWAVALASGVTETQAQDLVQEAFLQCFRRIETLRSSDAFGPWLAGIVRNLVRVHIRSSRRKPVEVRPRAASSSPVEDLSEGELRTRVANAVFALPEAVREAIFLYYYEGQSVKAVADALGVSDDTAKNRLRRGRELLRRRLWEELGTELRDHVPTAEVWRRRGRRISIVILAALPIHAGRAAAASGAGEGVPGGAGVPRPSVARPGPWLLLIGVALPLLLAVVGLLATGRDHGPAPGPSSVETSSVATAEPTGGSVSRGGVERPAGGAPGPAPPDPARALPATPTPPGPARGQEAGPDGNRVEVFEGGTVELLPLVAGETRYATRWYINRSTTEICGFLADAETVGPSYLGLIGVAVEVDPRENPEADFDVTDLRDGIWNQRIDPEEDRSADEAFDDAGFDGAHGLQDDTFNANDPTRPAPHRAIVTLRSHGSCIGEGDRFRVHVRTGRPVAAGEEGTIEVRQRGTDGAVLHDEGVGVLVDHRGALSAGRVTVTNETGIALRRVTLAIEMRDDSFYLIQLARLERDREDQLWTVGLDGNTAVLTPLPGGDAIDPGERITVYYRLDFIAPPGGGAATIRGFRE